MPISGFELALDGFTDPPVERFAGVFIEPFAPLILLVRLVPLVICEPELFVASFPVEELIPAPLRIKADSLTPDELGVIES